MTFHTLVPTQGVIPFYFCVLLYLRGSLSWYLPHEPRTRLPSWWVCNNIGAGWDFKQMLVKRIKSETECYPVQERGRASSLMWIFFLNHVLEFLLAIMWCRSFFSWHLLRDNLAGCRILGSTDFSLKILKSSFYVSSLWWCCYLCAVFLEFNEIVHF